MTQDGVTDQIIQEVHDYIVTQILIGDSKEYLDPNDSLLEHGILNSTGVLELVAFIEERYAISCADVEITLENLDSVISIATFVLRKLSLVSTEFGAK